MNGKRLRIPCALLLAAASPTVWSQSTASVLDEIVVTAQKRSESLQDVPVAVSAFTSETRDLLGISTIQDLTNFTPGLSYSTSLDRASLRGIGRQTNNLASDPGVATYTDGFYNVSTRSAARSPLLVERIEILRGPQGTLYGRNSIGGTINVISKRPTEDWTGEVRLSYDNWDRKVFEGTFSGPITDWLRFRLAGNITKQTEGYFTNVSGGPDEGGVEDDHYVEAQLAADFGDSVSAWLKASVNGYDNSRRAAALVGDYDYGKIPAGYLAPAGAYGLVLSGSDFEQQGGNSTTNPALNDIRSFSTDVPTRNKLDNSPAFVAHLNWNLGGADLKYIGGYTSYEYTLTTDYDGTAVRAYTIPLAAGSTCTPPGCLPLRYRPSSIQYYIEDKEYFSNELNLSSNGDGALQWIVGLYRYDEKYKQPVYFPTENAALLTPTFSVAPGFVVTPGAAPNPTGWIYYIDTHLRTKSQAAFGQIDWAITDAWKLTAGLRYTQDEKSGSEHTRQLCYGLTSFYGCPDLAINGTDSPSSDATNILIYHNNPPGTTGEAVRDAATGIWSRGLSHKWSATTGTAGIAWTPSADTLAFAKYSRGYKAGGFNSGAIVQLPLTEAESVDAFEMGWKQQLGGQFQINTSLFYYLYDGMQIPLSVNPPGGGPTQTQFFNMDVTSKGAELETIWRPIDALQVLFNYAYLDPIIKKSDKSCCFVDGTDVLGTQPDATPVGPVVGTGANQSRGQELAGQRVPQSPANKVALSINYTFNFEAGNLIASVSDTWKDHTYFSVFNRWYSLAPSYHQVDMRITWQSANDHLTVVAFGRNVLDDLGYDGTAGLRQAQIPSGGTGVPTIPASIAQSVSLTPPRTYGIELRYKF
jgi:iron complex outermembrane receptor protein